MLSIRQKGPRGQEYGSQFAFAVALIVLGLLWGLTDMQAWARVLSWAAVGFGIPSAIYFGWRYLHIGFSRSR